MESILGIMLMVAIYAGASALFRAGAGTVKAAARTATGKGDFRGNMRLEFEGMGPFEIRIRESHLEDDDSGPVVLEIEGRGLMPVPRKMEIGFVTSVFDATDGEFRPVLSTLEEFQEPDSICYQHAVHGAIVGPDEGFGSWARLGVVLPDLLVPPRSGARKFTAVVRIVDSSNSPPIEFGFSDAEHPGLIHIETVDFRHTHAGKGYEEEAEHRDEARCLAIEAAVSVAMSDGSLDDREGLVIQEWIRKHVAMLSEEKKSKALRDRFNDTLRRAYARAKAGEISLSRVTERIDEIAEDAQKYEAVDLCFDVMAADGVADEEELQTIHRIADALELDYDELQAMRDKRLVGLHATAQQAGPEALLGINPAWDDARILQHLTSEYRKWNGRLNTLKAGTERENAQRMLNLIAESREKYRSGA